MLKTPLYPFQKEGVRRIHESGGRHLLCDEMSLGKTIQSLYYGWRYLSHLRGPMVAVVPAHLKYNWVKEAEKHLGEHIEILSEFKVPPDKRPPVNPNQIYAINYDILVPRRWNPQTALPEDSWAFWLRSLRPRYIVADEAQALKHHGSLRSRAFRKMARGCPHVVLLTGTPITGTPMDLWPLLNITHPHLYPSRWEFGQRFTRAVKRRWGWCFEGAKDLDILHRELTESGIMTRRRKADVAADLPALTQEAVHLDVDLTEYRRAEDDFLNWLARKDTLASKRAAKAEELAKKNHLRRLAGELKVPAATAWVRDFLAGSESKLLLGATHYKVTGPLMETFGSEAVLIDGTLSAKEKQARTDIFNDPRSPARLCVGNMQSAGTGWNCTVTSDAAVVELDWLPSTHEQFWGRIYGLNRGVKGVPVTVRWLVAVGTIDEDILKMLSRKHKYSELAIDGGRPDEDADYDEIVEAMKQRRQQGKSKLS